MPVCHPILETYQTVQQTDFTLPSNEKRVPELYMKRFSIIIPAYNEEKRISPVLNDICHFIWENGLPWDIIVAIDGNDNTEILVKKMMINFAFLNYIRGNGRNGKGGAIRRAITFASGDYVMLMDADGAIAFDEITKHLNLLDRYDLINFDRYKNKENEIPKLRRFVSRGYNFYIRMLFNLDINDTQCGYKIMRTADAKEVFNKLTITNGFFYSPLFVYLKKMKVNIIEVSVNYQHSDGSKFSVPSMILGGFVSALAFRIRNSPFWKYVPKKLVVLYNRKFRWI
jgi:glycosyltransferase involved in cell wall biosynthesis